MSDRLASVRAKRSRLSRAAWLGGALELFGRSSEYPAAFAAATCARMDAVQCRALAEHGPTDEDWGLLAACLAVEIAERDREWRALERLLSEREHLPGWGEDLDQLDDPQVRRLAVLLAGAGWLSVPPPEPPCDPIPRRLTDAEVALILRRIRGTQ